MAEQKQDEPARASAQDAPKKAAPASSEAQAARPAAASDARQAPRAEAQAPRRRYLVAARPGVALPADAIHESLKSMEDVEIVRRLPPKGPKGLSLGAARWREVIVARMDERSAQALLASAPAQVIVEPDCPLRSEQATLTSGVGPFNAAPRPAHRQEIRFRVLADDGQPIVGAGVTLFDRGGFAAQGLTDTSGAAVVTTFNAEAGVSEAEAVYIQPASGYWEAFVRRPAIDPKDANVIRLQHLETGDGDGATTPPAGWGLRAMGLDRRRAELTGAGVRIALISSGCDTGHRQLSHVSRGLDLTHGDGGGEAGWTRDEVGEGTHLAGIIAAKDGSGVGGIAPSAEVHVFKVAPGGRCGDLIEAIDQCIERQVDIACFGVICEQPSDLVAQKIAEARARGVACIAPSGDAGGAVQYPGAAPGALCVSAVGRLGEFPRATHHGLTSVSALAGPGGFFATAFGGSGPRIDVCGPGVAVISTSPGGGFAARDGAAIAAAHVAGLAALVLAHHPLFRGPFAARGEQRVDALFELIRSSAMPPVFDPSRVGAGLPDLQRVAGLTFQPVEAWGPPPRSFAASADTETIAAALGGPLSPAGLSAAAMAVAQLRASGLI